MSLKSAISIYRLGSQYLQRTFGFDHINRNAPVLIRTPKLTRFEPAQYWGGGPPGNSVVLNPFLLLIFPFILMQFSLFSHFLIVFGLRYQQALALFCHAFDVCEVLFRVCLVPPWVQKNKKNTHTHTKKPAKRLALEFATNLSASANVEKIGHFNLQTRFTIFTKNFRIRPYQP